MGFEVLSSKHSKYVELLSKVMNIGRIYQILDLDVHLKNKYICTPLQHHSKQSWGIWLVQKRFPHEHQNIEIKRIERNLESDLLSLTRFFCLQVWKLAGHGLMHSFSNEHAKQSIFRNIGAGVMQVEMSPGNRIFTCGADGTLKMRVLPDRYNIPSSLVDIL